MSDPAKALNVMACPFCLGKEIQLRTYTPPAYKGGPATAWAMCTTCGARGPTVPRDFASFTNAALGWNTRPTIQEEIDARCLFALTET